MCRASAAKNRTGLFATISAQWELAEDFRCYPSRKPIAKWNN